MWLIDVKEFKGCKTRKLQTYVELEYLGNPKEILLHPWKLIWIASYNLFHAWLLQLDEKFIDKKIKKKLMESTYFNDVTNEYPTTLFIISEIKKNYEIDKDLWPKMTESFLVSWRPWDKSVQ